MTSEAPARKVAVSRTRGRRGVSRFGNQTPGDSDETSTNRADTVVEDDEGLSNAIVKRHLLDGKKPLDVPLTKIAPHPLNHPSRSEPQPGDPKWEELVSSVRITGNKIPGLAVPRAEFLASRPTLASRLGDAEYVLIYGHRRRAALISAGRETISVLVDPAVMADDGDLDAMTLENLGRLDLTELAEAEIYARYSEELGMSQRGIAERLGVDQGTVSRRLALLLLSPEAQRAVDDKSLRIAVAAALSGALPYGPVRRWQKSADPAQNSAERRTAQNAALGLILSQNMDAKNAVERVLAEERSRAKAAEEGLTLIDPADRFGGGAARHRLASDAAVQRARKQGSLLAAIEQAQGTLVYYTAEIETPTEEPAAAEEPAEQRGDRRPACIELAQRVPSREVVGDLLVDQLLHGVESPNVQLWRAANDLAQGADLPIQGKSAAELRTASLAETDPRRRTEIAWLLAIARAEMHSQRHATWTSGEETFVKLLIDRTSYVPTQWESDQLAAITSGELA